MKSRRDLLRGPAKHAIKRYEQSIMMAPHDNVGRVGKGLSLAPASGGLSRGVGPYNRSHLGLRG
jgi:hypothetical protein